MNLVGSTARNVAFSWCRRGRPGKKYVYRFLKRHNLSIRTTEKLGKSRAKVSREDIVEHFNNLGREFDENHFIFMATSLGTVKKTPLSDFANPRKSVIIAINLDEGDFLIGAEITNGSNDVILVSNGGKAVWFTEDDVRSMGRATRGVRGMKLSENQQVLSLLIADNEQQSVLVATENGYGKRTVLSDFRHSGRGTQGVKAIAISERNGLVVAAKLVNEDDEIMLITTGGVLIRTRVKEIRELGRATQGVTLINLGEGEKLSGLEKIVESDDPESEVDTDATLELVASIESDSEAETDTNENVDTDDIA